MTLVKDDSPEEHGSLPCFAVRGNPYSGPFSVTFEDRPIEHIKSISITMNAAELPEVTITLQPGAVDVELFAHLKGTFFVTTEQLHELEHQDPELPF